jgi:hypothetical protein
MNSGAPANRIVADFDQRLAELRDSRGLQPGMAICTLANLNCLGHAIPASLITTMDDTDGVENAKDAAILAEARRAVRGGHVVIAAPTRTRVGRFMVQYNHVRGFRPRRGARRSDISLEAPYDPDHWSFADARCDPEVFSTAGSADLLFNRYPFAPYHFLWVPDRKEGHRGQYLDWERDEPILAAAWDLVQTTRCWLGYNSNGAHASVNHLHLQGFVPTADGQPSLEIPLRGVRSFPASTGIAGLGEFIRRMNHRWRERRDNAYHFVMHPEGITCFPRRHQGDARYFARIEAAPFTTGIAFYELLGEIVSPSPRVPTETEILDLLGSLAL